MPAVTVAVVIPVLDDAAELAECLAALGRQTRVPEQIIVVDNGCRDESVSIAAAAGARVVFEPRRGIPAAVAAGYDACQASVIARCDADTRVPPDWIERIAARFETHPDLVGLTGPGRFVDMPAAAGRLAWAFYAAGYFGAAGAAGANVPLWGSNMALRTSAWRQVAPRVHRSDPGVHDDLDLSLALGPTARIDFDPALRVGVRGRMFHSWAASRHRFVLAARTLRLGWAWAGPGQRWLARWTGRRRPAGLPRPASHRKR
ncbi:glycosyltransferase family 2 protein [Gephyromycinifex aptenodytis]|uniref:glycosyltransferase family 2 protein n=1 Tax=Gephyromycinifex aptenodytis TaxID=2716227 RepID=UPI001B2FF1E0|nr:glycosyltransferase family 2 protein [Gephyromycinifex aptenodytis]